MGVTINDSSSSSDTVYECLSLEGEVIGEAPALLVLGGVLGLFEEGDAGDAGRRKGDERGTVVVGGDLNEDCELLVHCSTGYIRLKDRTMSKSVMKNRTRISMLRQQISETCNYATRSNLQL